MRNADVVKGTSSFHVPERWIQLFDLLPNIVPGYAEAMVQIQEQKELLAFADIAGKHERHVGGFSPSGNQRLDLSMPYEASLLAKALFGPDVFTTRWKRNLFRQTFPQFDMKVRR